MVEVVGQGEPFPAWCELRALSIHDLSGGADVKLTIRHPRARLLVTAGSCQVRQGGGSQVLRDGQFVPLELGEAVLAAQAPTQALLLEGSWGDELGGCGLFRAENVANPSDRGDPVSYPKHTNIDAHYHDCDEYWLLLEGRATVVVDGAFAAMAPGDCLLIPMGAIHDMPEAPEPVKAVYFESSLRGQKRIGHLWQHTHGPARPKGTEL
jgi:mannose-6-phosphate isomerase-like protein (cupin superfamily)